VVHGRAGDDGVIVVARRAVGHPTRGKTAPNRLRRVDTFVLCYDPGVLRLAPAGRCGLFVDVGFGEDPVTTLESAARFRRHAPGLYVVGVEIDRARVAAAAPLADAHTVFRQGGFDLPVGVPFAAQPERPGLIRAFNVLRQYGPDEVGAAWSLMGRHLLPGGLLIEGTSDPRGRVWSANLLRAAPTPAEGSPAVGPAPPRPLPCGSLSVVPEGLAFSFNLRSAFSPDVFAPVLPKSLIHLVVPGEPIHAFLAAWRAHVRALQPLAVWGPRPVFVAAAQRLRQDGYRVDVRRRLLGRGFLVWRDGCRWLPGGRA
jgi:hypothetical protein